MKGFFFLLLKYIVSITEQEEGYLYMSDLKPIFRHSKDEVWKELSKEIGAEFIEGGRRKSDKLCAKVKEWTVTLDTYSVTAGGAQNTYTRMRSPYINRDNFKFSIYHRDFLSDIGKLLGMQDITTGYSEFDREFIIKGNDKEKVKLLLANSKICELIQKEPTINLLIKEDEGWFTEDFPEGIDELYLEVTGVVKDVKRLKSMFDLFSEILNHLCHIGSAYENDPKLSIQ